MKRLFLGFIYILSTILTALCISNTNVFAAAFSDSATPTEYIVTLKNVSFHKSGTALNDFIPYASGAGQFDIARATSNKPAGNLNPTGQLSAGNYDEVLFSISKSITIKGASTNLLSNGLPCRTVNHAAAINDPFGDGSVSIAYLGATDGGMPESETVTVSSGTGVDLPIGLIDQGKDLEGRLPFSFNVAGNVPIITTRFDITHSIIFAAYGKQCLVFLKPPSVIFSTYKNENA